LLLIDLLKPSDNYNKCIESLKADTFDNGKGGEYMSDLSFIPSATASKPARNFLQPLSEKNPFETRANFDQFLKNAKENQFETKKSLNKPESFRPAEIEAKQSELDRDQSGGQSVREGSTPPQEAVADREKTDSSKLRASKAEGQEKAVEGQNEEVQQIETPVVATPVATDQEELLALIANPEVQAVTQGSIQPETVQPAELNEPMANSELTETIQGTTVAEVQPITIGSKIPVSNSEIPVINRVEHQEIPAKTVLTVDDLKSNPKTLTEGKTADLGKLNQVIPLMSQVSGETLQSEGNSLFNQEKSPDTKNLITTPVKNTNMTVRDESQAVNKMAFKANSMIQKANVQVQPGEALVTHGQIAVKDRVLANEQTADKDGKVDLAMIQTHLAVNDAPKVKTEKPVLNIIATQPSINNTSHIHTSGSTEVNSINREELFSQIVEHAKVMVNNGGSEMEVNLKPEHLGKLQLKVTIENEAVTAKFVTESEQVKEIIESNLGQLKRNLQESGMQVDTIMVSVGNHQGSQSFEQAPNNQDGFGSFKGSFGTGKDDLDLTPEDTAPLKSTDALIDLIA